MGKRRYISMSMIKGKTDVRLAKWRGNNKKQYCVTIKGTDAEAEADKLLLESWINGEAECPEKYAKARGVRTYLTDMGLAPTVAKSSALEKKEKVLTAMARRLWKMMSVSDKETIVNAMYACDSVIAAIDEAWETKDG